MQVKVVLDLDLYIPDNDDIKNDQAFLNQYIYQERIVQELMNKLYVGYKHYEDDVFSVIDLHVRKFAVTEGNNEWL